MLETSARLLALLSLFQGRRSWGGEELAERLEVTTRTLRRDVDKLRSLGYPIRSTPGVEGGYQLGAGSTMPPLLLDDDEAVAVALGLGCAATGGVEGMEEASVRALAKIEQLLPPRLGRRVGALQSMIVSPPSGAAVDGRVLATIAGACRDCEALRFRYLDHAGAASLRSVEPHRLVHTGRRWYLVAWDCGREDWRTFRVDRVQGRVSAGGRFVAREGPAKDLAAYVSRGIAYAPPCRGRVRLFVSAESIAAKMPWGAVLVEAVDERSCVLEFGAASYEYLAMHLAMLAGEFEVMGPGELVEAVRGLGVRLLGAIAERGGSGPDV
jgi:predicted DNA-binding transcriptional regulator YafY